MVGMGEFFGKAYVLKERSVEILYCIECVIAKEDVDSFKLCKKKMHPN